MSSRRFAAWTRSWSPISCSSRRSSRTAATISSIADEAWEVDHFWHEHPELKRGALAWLTDFVGYMPMPEGGDARGASDRRLQRRDDRAHRALSARARRGHLRRQSRGYRPGTFGPGLPDIRGWTEEHFEFSGYIIGRHPGEIADRAALRAKLGYAADEKVCIVTVGGSGVGGHCCGASSPPFPRSRRRRPGVAHDRRRGPAHRCRQAAARARGRDPRLCSRSRSTSPPATSPSCKAD